MRKTRSRVWKPAPTTTSPSPFPKELVARVGPCRRRAPTWPVSRSTSRVWCSTRHPPCHRRRPDGGTGADRIPPALFLRDPSRKGSILAPNSGRGLGRSFIEERTVDVHPRLRAAPKLPGHRDRVETVRVPATGFAATEPGFRCRCRLVNALVSPRRPGAGPVARCSSRPRSAGWYSPWDSCCSWATTCASGPCSKPGRASLPENELGGSGVWYEPFSASIATNAAAPADRPLAKRTGPLRRGRPGTDLRHRRHQSGERIGMAQPGREQLSASTSAPTSVNPSPI